MPILKSVFAYIMSQQCFRHSARLLHIALVLAMAIASLPVASNLVASAASYACTEAGLDQALSAGGSATFSCPSNSTITLTGSKTVSKDLSIDGGTNLTISGNNTYRIFLVTGASKFTLNNARLINGSSSAGGAIENFGTLVISNTTFMSNTAPIGGAVYSTNVLTATNSTFTGNTAVDTGSGSYGGALYNFGSMALINNSIQNNTNALYGGGLYNDQSARLTINGGNFTGNASTDSGGAIFNMADTYPATISGVTFANNATANKGAAIYNDGSTLVISNSIFDSNSMTAGGLASGTAIFNDGDGIITLTNNIISGNTATYGGGIFNKNSISGSGNTFSGNSASFGAGIYNNQGSVTLTSGSFSQNTTNHEGAGIYNQSVITLTGTSFISNTATNSGAAIENFGTAALTSASFTGNSTGLNGGAILNANTLNITSGTFTGNTAPAAGAIYNTGALNINTSSFSNNSATDVTSTLVYTAGAIYNDGGNATINATSFQSNTATIGGDIYNDGVNSFTATAITSTQSSATSGGSIYNNAHGPATISGSYFALNTATSGGSIYNNGGTNLTVSASQILTASAPNGAGIYNAAGANLTVNGSSFISNTATSSGAAINNHGVLAANYSSFINGTATAQGGGIYNATGASMNVSGSTFTTNTSKTFGGALDNDGSMQVSGTTFDTNRANDVGGSIYNTGTGLISTGVFSNNLAIHNGGGIYSLNTLTVTGSSFYSNTATGGSANGGAIYNASRLSVSSSSFTGNTVLGFGGAILNATASSLTMNGGSFTANSASRGGALYNQSSTANINGTTFTANTSTGSGGAVYNDASSTLAITGSNVLTNTSANFGGGIDSLGTVSVDSTNINGNSAPNGGGGLMNESGSATISNSTMNANTTPKGGGAILSNNAVTVLTTTITNNSAQYGGGIYSKKDATIIASSINNNTASNNGGGIYEDAGRLVINASTLAFNTAGGSGSGNGGGIEIGGPASAIVITNSTISQNSSGYSGGGLANDTGAGTTILNSTFYHNNTGYSGGDITGSVTIANSIIGLGTPNSCGNFVTSGGYNVMGSSCGIVPGTDTEATDPQLGPLQFNGGPTMTHAPISTSVVLDRIPVNGSGKCPTAPPVDQRGVSRPQGAACDSGAYEAASFISIGGLSPVSATLLSPDFTLTVTGTGFISGATVLWNGTALNTTYGSNTQLTAIVTSSLIKANGGGTVNISVRNPLPDGASTSSLPFTIIAQDQTISFPPIGNKYVIDAPFLISATASSGLTVTFNTDGPCFTGPNELLAGGVTSATMYLNNSGTCSITAQQSGNYTFSAAAAVTQTFTVSKSEQTVTFLPITNRTTGDSSFTISATASSSLIVSFTTNGPCTVSKPVLLNGGVTSATVSFTTGGPCDIGAQQAGNFAYNPSPVVTQTFTISKLNQSIIFSLATQHTLAESPMVITAAASSGLTVTFTTNSATYCSAGPSTLLPNGVTSATLTLNGEGTCVVTASQAGNNQYNAAPSVIQSFTLAQASQSINFAALPNKVATDQPFTLTASASSGLPVTYTTTSSACSVSGATVTITGTGTCTITAHQSGNTAYKAAADVSQTFTISQAGQTISFTQVAPKAISDPPFPATATATSGLMVSITSSSPAICQTSSPTLLASGATSVTVTINAAGSCTLLMQQSGNSTYSAAPAVTETIAINNVNQTISFSAPSSKLVTDQPFPISATATSGLTVTFSAGNGNPCSVGSSQLQGNGTTSATVTILGAGSCTITAQQSGNQTYTAAAAVSQTIAINKVPQTITFTLNAIPTSPTQPFTISATASSNLLVGFTSTSSGTCTVGSSTAGANNTSTATVTPLAPGVCTLVASQNGDTTFASATPVTRSYTISGSVPVITFPQIADQNLTASQVVISASSSYTPTAITFNSNTATCSVGTGTLISNGVTSATVTLISGGACTITASQPADANHFAATPISRTFTIVSSNQTITFPPIADKSVNDPSFVITASASSRLLVSFTTSGPCSVGTPTLSNGVTSASVSLTKDTAGTCTITANQAGNADWKPAAAVSQQFTINGAGQNQSISFDPLPNRMLADSPFTLNATTSSGLPVTYTASSPTGACSVSGNTVTLSSTGSCSITAHQSGSPVFGPAQDVIRTFQIFRSRIYLPETIRQNNTGW